MNTNQAHYRLIEIAAELARAQAVPSDQIDDWPARNIGRARVLKMLERTEDELMRLACEVREASDTQAREIRRLRDAIEQVTRESHVPTTGICALHIVANDS